jgi:hypothetical protein
MDYSNVREFLGHLIGRRIEDVTQHDEDEFAETRQAYVMLLLEGGHYLQCPIGDDGLSYSDANDA